MVPCVIIAGTFNVSPVMKHCLISDTQLYDTIKLLESAQVDRVRQIADPRARTWEFAYAGKVQLSVWASWLLNQNVQPNDWDDIPDPFDPDDEIRVYYYRRTDVLAYFRTIWRGRKLQVLLKNTLDRLNKNKGRDSIGVVTNYSLKGK